jgi:8-oxo-dGTP pyrophosphatase MutT (NUDIX family)
LENRPAWPYAVQHVAEIDAHWQRRLVQSPKMFNGRIYLLAEYAQTADALNGVCAATDFKSFLFWREAGYPEAGVRDCFGSGLIRSSDGAVLLGRQTAGNMNAGLAYLPGGFIDERDVTADGRIDIDGSVARELTEETGLLPYEIAREPGYYITHSSAQLSIAVPYRSPLAAEPLRRLILERLAADSDPELDDIVIVRRSSELGSLAVPRYTALLLETLLPK